MSAKKSPRLTRIGTLILLPLVFSLSYSLMPLYSWNQNAYFLQGLAKGGLGFLSKDWLANTVDPVPVFSLLVKVTFSYLHEYLFYLYSLVLLGVYICSMLGIVSHTYKVNSSGVQYLAYFVVITGLHSPVLGSLSLKLAGLDITQLLHNGLAGQYLLGPVFQPSMFGVLLLLSLYLFLRGKSFLAIFCSSLSASIHPTYLLSAAVLTLTYMIILFKERKDLKPALLIGGLALVLIIPISTYVYLSFKPSSPELLSQAQGILVDERIPHHTKTSRWFGQQSVFQILLIMLALFLVRKKRLFSLLSIPFLLASALTIVQVMTKNKGFALQFPWRSSVFLVPIASCIIVAAMLSFCFKKFNRQISIHKRALTLSFVIAMLMLTLSGLIGTGRRFAQAADAENIPVMNFVREIKQPDDIFLIPIEMERFRLYTGVPIFVDEKAHPYKDGEILEWNKRIQMATEFYQRQGESACRMLRDLAPHYGITHVILENAVDKPGCAVLREIYRDEKFVVHKVRTD